MLLIPALAILGIFAGYFVAKAQRPSAKQLALRMEKLHPELMDSLICALEKEQLSEDEKGFFDNQIIASVQNLELLQNAEHELIPKKLNQKRVRILLLFSCIFFVVSLSSRFTEKSINRFKEIIGKISPGIIVEPGNTDVEINSDLKILAQINRWEKEATVIYEDAAGQHSFKMNFGKNQKAEFTFYDINSPISYRVETPSLKSNTFRISPFTPPKLKNARLKVIPPKYTRKPETELNAIENLSIPVNSKISIFVNLTPENAKAILLDSKSNAVRFEKIANEDFHYRLDIQATANNEFSLRLDDNNGHKSIAGSFKVETIPDLPPVIEIISPGIDLRVASNSNVAFTVSTCDDYGITSIGFVYSVSGKNPLGNILYPSLDSSPSDHPPVKILSDHSLSIEKTGAQPGEVITCYFYATDNCEPRQHTSRTELIFIEIKEPEAEMNADGSGSKEKIDILRLVVELKRLIRLTYELMSMPEMDSEKKMKSNELTRNLAALRIEGRTLLQQIISKFPQLDPKNDPLLSKFDDALNNIETAETSARSENYSSSISNQQKALSLLTYVAQQLMKNISGKGQGEGETSNAQDKKQDQKDVAQRVSLKDIMDKLNKTLADLASAAKRQDSINSSLDALPASPSAEIMREIAAKQVNLEKETREIKEKIPKLPISERLGEEINSAADHMARGEMNSREGKTKDALASGRLAYSSLLSSMELVRQAMKKIVSDQIDAIANSAEALSKKQMDESARSASASQSSDGKAKAKELRNSQNELNDSAKFLAEQAQELSKILENDYPETSASISQTIPNSTKAQTEMKKALNSLLYAKFAKASEHQKNAATEIANFADSMRKTKKTLPKISQEEIFALMQKIREAAVEMDAATKSKGAEGKPDPKSLAKTAGKIGRDLESAGENMDSGELTDLGTALQNLDFNDIQKGGTLAMKMLAEADFMLRSYLMKFEIQRRTEMKRRTSSPPEKYRSMVEEYFKSLSE